MFNINFDLTHDKNNRVRKLVKEDLLHICSFITSKFHEVVEIILNGSFSFGEGIYSTSNSGNVKLISDYDIYLVVNSFKKPRINRLIFSVERINYQINGTANFHLIFYPLRRFYGKIEGRILFSKFSKKQVYLAENTVQDCYNQLVNLKVMSYCMVRNNPIYQLENKIVSIKALLPYLAFYTGKKRVKFEYRNNLDYLIHHNRFNFDNNEFNLFKRQIISGPNFSVSDWFISKSILNKYCLKVFHNKKGCFEFSANMKIQMMRFLFELLIVKNKISGIQIKTINPYEAILAADFNFINSIKNKDSFYLDNLKRSYNCLKKIFQPEYNQNDLVKHNRDYWMDLVKINGLSYNTSIFNINKINQQ
jgi:hypothetical protein